MNRSDAEILWDVARVLARDAAKVSRAAPPRALPPLLFFTDPGRTPRPWETAARLPAGSGVVFRHFGRPDAHDTALRLREVTAKHDLVFLIGRDVELAERVGADGLHLPEQALDDAKRLSQVHPDWLLTGAAHADGRLDVAHLHARMLSPVFVAGGSSSAAPPLGLATFRSMAASAACPVYALGGIDARNAGSLANSGACGLAGVSAIRKAFAA